MAKGHHEQQRKWRGQKAAIPDCRKSGEQEQQKNQQPGAMKGSAESKKAQIQQWQGAKEAAIRSKEASAESSRGSGRQV